MSIAPTKKELIAQAEASEAALRDIWKTVSNRLAPPDLHVADRAGDVAASLTSAAETAVVRMKANPYATGLIGAGALLLLFGATRSAETRRKTVAEAQSHPITSTVVSLALGAGVAALMPQNRGRLLALLPAAGVLLDQVRRMFQTQDVQDEPEPEAKPRKTQAKRTAAAKTADQPRKSAPKRTRKPAAAKTAQTPAADVDSPRNSGATVN